MTVDEAPVVMVPVRMPDWSALVTGPEGSLDAGATTGVVGRETSGTRSRAGALGTVVTSLEEVTSILGSSTAASCACAEAQLKTAMHPSRAERQSYLLRANLLRDGPMIRVLRLRCRAASRAPGEQGPTRRTHEDYQFEL